MHKNASPYFLLLLCEWQQSHKYLFLFWERKHFMSGVSILVTSHACFGENLRLTLWDGMFSIDVRLLKNIALEDAD